MRKLVSPSENSTEFKAGDIGKYLTGFEVLNPELVICHLDAKASMQIDLQLTRVVVMFLLMKNREFCTDANVFPNRFYLHTYT